MIEDPQHTLAETEISNQANKQGFTKSLDGWQHHFDANRLHIVGVLPGEGIGPEIVPVAVDLLKLLMQYTDRRFELRYGGLIGTEAKMVHGRNLTNEVMDFSREIFAEHGALFCGPGGDRFVYDLRVTFDLFCKFTPLQPTACLKDTGVIRPEHLRDIDIIAVRENTAGLYQGKWDHQLDSDGRKTASHAFSYDEAVVDRILVAALKLAAQRNQRLAIVLKPGGVPAISTLWSERASLLGKDYPVEIQELEIDNATYQLIANPQQFDVIVSPNMFGDVLADCGALLLGSRGMSFSGNFGNQGVAVFQTGHGAAKDLAGKGIANPVAQILSLAMMLRESFSWDTGANALIQAVDNTLSSGIRTQDIAAAGSKVVDTVTMGKAITDNLKKILDASEL